MLSIVLVSGGSQRSFPNSHICKSPMEGTYQSSWLILIILLRDLQSPYLSSTPWISSHPTPIPRCFTWAFRTPAAARSSLVSSDKRRRSFRTKNQSNKSNFSNIGSRNTFCLLNIWMYLHPRRYFLWLYFWDSLRMGSSGFLFSVDQKSWAVKLPPGNTRNMDGTAMGPWWYNNGILGTVWTTHPPILGCFLG